MTLEEFQALSPLARTEQLFLDMAAVKTVVDSLSARIGAAAAITVVAPVTTGGHVTIFAGSDYTGARALVFPVPDWVGPDLDSLTGKLRIMRTVDWVKEIEVAQVEVDAEIVQAGDDLTITAELADTDTDEMDTSPPDAVKNYRWQIVVDVDGTPFVVAAAGTMTVMKTIMPAGA